MLLLCKICALVIKLLTTAETNLYLHKRFTEVNPERNESVALLLELSENLVYLVLMHEKLTVSEGVLVEDITLLIRIDMHALDEDLAVSYAAVSLLDGALAQSQGLYFGTRKLDAALVSLVYKIIVTCFFVQGNYLVTCLFLSHAYSSFLRMEGKYITFF